MLNPANARLTGIGSYVPAEHLGSEAIDARLGLATGTLARRSGVASRPVAAPAESQEMMGCRAAEAALADAGCGIGDIDLLLFAAAVGRQPIPATGPLIKHHLGAGDLSFPAYDVNATCLSALVALDQAIMAVETGRARTVLVVTSEIANRALPWDRDIRTASLFGDGAAALVVQASDAGLVPGPLHMETWSDGYEACQLAAGGTRFDYQKDRAAFDAASTFQMDGRALYKLTSKRLPDFLERVLATAGWTRDGVDLVVPHQASPHALAHIVQRCGFHADQVFDMVRTMGNQVAASLPIALCEARAAGRVVPGAKLLLIGTSAGVSLGAMTLTVPA